MKRNFCYVLLMLLALAGNINADELKIADIALSPGQQAEVAVELDNPDNQFIMLEFYIQLPEGIRVASDEDGYLMYELNSARTLRSHLLEMTEQTGGNYHVLLYSSRNEALKGSSGAVFTMTVEADASIASGTYTGKLANQITSDPNKKEIDFPDKTFSISVTSESNDYLTIADIEIGTGQQKTVEVELVNPDNQFIMLEFYIQLPEGIRVASDEDGYLMYELNSARTLRSHLLEMTEQTGGNYHVLLYSSRNEALKGTSGAVFTMTLEADATLEPGEYEGKLTNQITSDPDKNEIDFPDRTFKITVVNTEDVRVILDENATVIPDAATGVNVRVKRTIPANSWSTIVLPFDMDETQVKSAFGEDVQLLDFNGYVTEEDEEGNIVAIEIQFNPLTSIEANHPCMIRVSKAITEFDADNVDIDPEEEPTVAAIRRTKKQWSEMIGTYTAGTEVPYTCIFVNGNNFYYSIGNTVMKGYRAYFDFYDVLTDIENEYAVKIRMSTLDNEPTSIDQIKKGSVSEGVYTIQGIFLGNNVNLESVPSGFYIVNGKKYIKK